MEEYQQIENTSKVYFNGSIWDSNNCGKFTIIGRIDKYYLTNNGKKKYNFYLCQFEDGTKIVAEANAIRNGKVKNPNTPSVCGVGYMGQGQWKTTINYKNTKEYTIWARMLERCYSERTQEFKFPYISYKNCIVNQRWHCFQKFCEDIQELENYQQWKHGSGWELDKDIKVKGNKIYSKDTCMFVLEKDNINEMIQRTTTDKLTGLTYVGINTLGEEFEFTNQREFAKTYNLNPSNVNRCLKGEFKQTKGWTFKTKDQIIN